MPCANAVVLDLRQIVSPKTPPAWRAERDYLRDSNHRMRSELEAAARIQRSLLPDRSPLMKGVRFAWDVEPSAELAGDSLNVFPLDDDHLAIYILDVSGHGLPAAMLSFTVHKFLSPPAILAGGGEAGGSRAIQSPAAVLRELNALFPMDPRLHLYFTLIYGILDVRVREFRFASAGHCPPIMLVPGGAPVEIQANGFPIGVKADADHDEHVLALDPGARFLLYTDGITDAEDEAQEPFGTERLMHALVATARRPLVESVSFILDAARDFSAGGRIADDASLLLVEID